MALKSDDSDLCKTWLKAFRGGNGDAYIVIVEQGDDGLKRSSSVRIAMSGGNAPTEIKHAAANLVNLMEKLGLNEHPDEEQ